MWLLSGILLILLLLCLRPLSILRRWAAVLSSRWDWSVFILKKSLLLCCRFCFCLLICLPLFGTRSVFAQTETPPAPTETSVFGTNTPIPPTIWAPTVFPTNLPTLTPTFHPLFPTSTPRPPGDNTCPGYQPIGAGIVTPNVAWLLKCAQCITPISRYTWPTAKPIATTNWDYGTPTPVPAATATPTNSPLTIRANILGVTTAIAQQVELQRPMTTTANNMGVSGYAISGIPMKYGVHEIGHIDSYRFAGPGAPEKLNIILGAGNYASNGIDIEVIESNISSLPVGIYHYAQNSHVHYLIHLRSAGVTYTDINWEIKYNVTILGLTLSGSGSQSFSQYDNLTYNTTVTGNTKVTWYPGGVPVIPPPITSDCSTIPVQSINDPNDPNFKLPYIGVGEGSCTGIPAITIGTSWLQLFFSSAPDSLSFGGVQFCFAPISFGSLNIFGIPIDLDLMAMVMAGVLMFKVITR